jgi:hypothetical protein
VAPYEHFPINKKALDLVVYIEQIAKDFFRCHKYTPREDLWIQSHGIVLLLIRANPSEQKLAILVQLGDITEQFKAIIQATCRCFRGVRERVSRKLVMVIQGETE